MKNIYLIRHAETDLQKSDSDPQLSDSGIYALTNRIELNWLKRIKQFDYIISSPLKRGIETANIIKTKISLINEHVIDNRLAPGCSAESLIDVVNQYSFRQIAIVGHSPDLTLIVSTLTGFYGMPLNFSYGTLAKIVFVENIELGQGKLDYFL